MEIGKYKTIDIDGGMGFIPTNNENAKVEYLGTYTLLDEILKRAVDTKKIDDFERYIDKFIELYVNTIGDIDE